MVYQVRRTVQACCDSFALISYAESVNSDNAHDMNYLFESSFAYLKIRQSQVHIQRCENEFGWSDDFD